MQRRTVLTGGLTALVASIGLNRGRALAPSGNLSALPSKTQLWRWIEELNRFGPRLTGSEAHKQSIAYLAKEMAAIGITVRRDTHKMTRWTARRAALSLADGTSLPVASTYPYSGKTGPAGVTAPLVWFDAPGDFSRANGKIAVVSVSRHDLTPATVDALFLRKARLPDASADFAPDGTSPLLGGLGATFLDQARKAGAVGVICVYTGLSPGQARDEVMPFTTPYADCPGLWVNEAEGHRLQAAAAKEQVATLVLEADLELVESDTLYAILPGASATETIIVNTHTDGPNAVEENGAAALLALARHQIARRDRQRTIVFVMVTGHFQIPQFSSHGQATAAWLDAHPELWDGIDGHARAVAGMTLEHLGCMEWKDDLALGKPKATGKIELEMVYTTNPTMERVFLAAVAGRTTLRAITLAPRTRRMFGEASPLYNVGIPTISLISSPDYLCQILPNGGLERLNADLAHQQLSTFARALLSLDTIPAADIGPVTPPIG